MKKSVQPKRAKAPGEGDAPFRGARAMMGRGGELPPELFYEVVEQAPVAVSITDESANILYVNRTFVEVTGYDGEEVIGHNESILSDKSTPREQYEALWSTIQSNRVWTGQLINRRKDGSRYLANLTITPVNDGAGNISHFLGMHRDVTEVRTLEQQVRNQTALIESVVESAPVVIVLLDEAHRVVKSNRAYQQLRDACGQEPAGLLLEGVGRRARHGLFNDVEVALRFDPARPVWYSCSAVPVSEADVAVERYFEHGERRYLLLTAHDITGLKEREVELRTAALRALTAEQELVHSLRETLNGAIFQVEGPFNLLAAAVGMLARRGESWPGAEPLLEVLREADEAGRQALRLLRDSMPIPPREAFVPVNLNQVLRDVLSLFTGRMLGEGVVVEWEPGEIPHCRAREGSLRGMFKQLIENALDAMGDSPAERRVLRVASRADGDELVVDVCDQGPGVPEEQRLKIFEPFFSTKVPYGRGTGMGLAMVQEVVNEHHGTVELVSGTAVGAQFRVRLPVDAHIGEEEA
ncbi:nitrogen fixation negative regulator NifL [Endothiovibrio diazotrophicus]